jgi:hypothetical protein
MTPSELRVELKGDQLVVSKPGTGFEATYTKVEGQPDLLLIAESLDPDADRAAKFKFRAGAFEAAMRKARELGWIV